MVHYTHSTLPTTRVYAKVSRPTFFVKIFNLQATLNYTVQYLLIFWHGSYSGVFMIYQKEEGVASAKGEPILGLFEVESPAGSKGESHGGGGFKLAVFVCVTSQRT